MNWSEEIEKMTEEEREAFLVWWRDHPPFSFQFDVQAIIAEAWREGARFGQKSEFEVSAEQIERWMNMSDDELMAELGRLVIEAGIDPDSI